MANLRTACSGWWLSLSNSTVGRQGLQALARTGSKREAGREGRRGERRAKAAQKKRGGSEKAFGGWSNEKMQEGAAGQEAQVGTRLCCPSLPTLHTALSHSKSVARDGAAQGWFGKNSMAAAQGLPTEPCCVAQGHCASLHAHRSLRALPTGRRRQSRPAVSASNSSLCWAITNSSLTVFPKERGTKSCQSLPWWV